MKKQLLTLGLSLTGALVFNALFWQEKAGLNLLLFDLFLLLALFNLYPVSNNRKLISLLLIGNLVSTAAILITNTTVAMIGAACTISALAIFMSFEHRSVFYAIGTLSLNASLLPAAVTEAVKELLAFRFRSLLSKPYMRYLVLPTVVAIPFLAIYANANQVFGDWLNAIGGRLASWFELFFAAISWERVLFFFVGFYITGSLLFKSRISYFSTQDLKQEDDLKRRKTVRGGWDQLFGKLLLGKYYSKQLALKYVRNLGVISLVILNLLLLAANIADVNYLWLHFEAQSAVRFSQLVHEGTDLLILSIVFAIAVLLFFFKGNLNFFSGNKGLNWLAYCWIIQNGILVFSVALRDYYYIQAHGLAHKRIGVIVFLLLVFAGLLTVFIKIRFRKSIYFLFRTNAWFAISLLVVSSLVNWDRMIAQYNLAHSDKVPVDIPFLLSLSDDALPELYANYDLIKKEETSLFNNGVSTSNEYSFTTKLDQKKQYFMRSQNNFSWLSWNYADQYTKKKLTILNK